MPRGTNKHDAVLFCNSQRRQRLSSASGRNVEHELRVRVFYQREQLFLMLNNSEIDKLNVNSRLANLLPFNFDKKKERYLKKARRLAASI